MVRTAAFSAKGGSTSGGQATIESGLCMFYLYILQSSLNGRTYIGSTADVVKRLEQHNKKSVRSTKAYIPWVLVYHEEYKTKTAARKREIELKTNSWKREELFRRFYNLVAPSSNG